jgi:hypothetical protein
MGIGGHIRQKVEGSDHEDVVTLSDSSVYFVETPHSRMQMGNRVTQLNSGEF